MLAYNHVAIMGTLTKDPMIRTVGTAGKKLAILSVCVNEKRKTPDGKVIDNVVFVDVDAWSKLAENCEKALKKHSCIFVDGTLQMAQWEKDGVRHQKLKIRARNIKFLPKSERGAYKKDSQTATLSQGVYVPEENTEVVQDDDFDSVMSEW